MSIQSFIDGYQTKIANTQTLIEVEQSGVHEARASDDVDKHKWHRRQLAVLNAQLIAYQQVVVDMITIQEDIYDPLLDVARDLVMFREGTEAHDEAVSYIRREIAHRGTRV